MANNAAVAGSLSEILAELGGIPAERVRREPAPGSAKKQDLLAVCRNATICELVDGTLVEKAMGWRESLLAMVLGSLVRNFVVTHNLGIVTGPDGLTEILDATVRSPDVAFTSWKRLPGGLVPNDAIPRVVPDLAVEVLSAGNTLTEMSRKRREYFHAGVRLVWMVDPRERSVAVYTSITDYKVLDEDQKLDGGNVLPGLDISLREVFAELDRRGPNGE